MKETWDKKKLGEVCEFIDRRGVTPEKLGSRFLDSGYRVISARNIKSRQIDPEAGEQRFVDEPTYRRWMQSPLLRDDVLLTSEAPLGEPAYIEEDLEWCLGQRLFGIRTNKSTISGRFLYLAFQSSVVREDLLSRATGATAQGIRQSELRNIEIPIPPLPEQQRIVTLLDEAFAGLAIAKANADRNLLNARAVFESHLESVFSERGEDWDEIALGAICDILDSRRKPITKRDRSPGDIPYYGATGIQDFVDDFIFDEPLILVGEDGAKWGSGEKTAFAVSGKIWVNNHAHVLRPHRKVIADYWLISYLVHADLSPFVSGLTVPKLNQASLREIPIPLPPMSTQVQLATNVKALEEETQRLAHLYQRKLIALEELKQSLLQQAFNGEL